MEAGKSSDGGLRRHRPCRRRSRRHHRQHSGYEQHSGGIWPRHFRQRGDSGTLPSLSSATTSARILRRTRSGWQNDSGRWRPLRGCRSRRSRWAVFSASRRINFVMIPIAVLLQDLRIEKGHGVCRKAIDQNHLMEAEDEVRMLLRAYPPSAAARGRYILDLRLRHLSQGMAQPHRRNRGHGHRCCFGLPGGRRRCHYEHHARGRDGTDA